MDKLKFKHFKFTKSSKKNVYVLKNKKLKFPTLEDMLKYYQQCPISKKFKNIGDMVKNTW